MPETKTKYMFSFSVLNGGQHTFIDMSVLLAELTEDSINEVRRHVRQIMYNSKAWKAVDTHVTVLNIVKLEG